MLKISGPVAERFRVWAGLLAEKKKTPEEIALEIMAQPELPEVLWPEIWESFLAYTCQRKSSGSFYTPETLIRSTLTRCFEFLDPAEVSETLTVLDPAAGAGDFLLGVPDAFQTWCQRHRIQKKLKLLAVDCDSGALAIAHRRLEAAFAQSTAISIACICQDALLGTSTFPQVDLVVGNPPFVASRMLPEGYRTLLKQKFRFATGRFNLFTLFMERASGTWLRPGGIAGMVVPDRLLRNVQLEGFRAFLTQEQRLLAIDEQAGKAHQFPGTALDCITAVWQAVRPESGDESFMHNERRIAVTDFPEALFAARLPVQWPCPVRPLGEIAQIRDGIIQSRVGDELFLRECRSTSCKKLLRGSDVSCDSIHFDGLYVDYRIQSMTKLEHERGGRGLRMRIPEIFETPKILTRQTADRIIAAWDEKGEYYYANTLHGIVVKDWQISPEFLMLWLNSDSLNDVYKCMSGETGRAFAQIKIALLRKLPVPILSLEQQKAFVSEYHRLTAAGRDKAVALGIIFQNFNGVIA